ncbi:hypothetical protein [Phaeobacter sp. NW0010-22]|uniref:hypothetical protein n=1 Tax=Phaeobacter sp. NW0010-22 TaxID=3135907 RepID=UPI0033409084
MTRCTHSVDDFESGGRRMANNPVIINTKQAQRSLSELAKVQSLFASPLNGRIKVGIPDDFDEGVLERALTEFSRSNWGVDVAATSGSHGSLPRYNM